MRYWYCYEPAKLGGRLIGKTRATEEEIRSAFGRCAHIDARAAVVTFWRKP